MAEEQEEKKNSHKKGLIWFTIVVLIIALAIFFYWLFWARFEKSTDDSYVHGNLVKLTPQVPGIITKIYGEDTQLVKEGMVLVELDKTDYYLAFEKSRAVLGETIRNVSQMFQQVYEIAHELKSKQADLIFAQIYYLDRKPLVEVGGVSREDFIWAETNLLSLRSQVEALQVRLLQSISAVGKTTVRTHPLVIEAIENLKYNWVNLQRCTIYASATGIIAERNAQVGESVNAQTPLLSIIPLDQIWVEANFKETHLTNIRIGQKAKVTSDIYGNDVDYFGEVIGIGGGTGAVFSALPPQNATGNWIKIVQRVPVRVKLDPSVIAKYPLRVGLSMHVRVNIRDQDGSRVPKPASDQVIYQTDVFADQELGIEPYIEESFAENLLFEEELSQDISLLATEKIEAMHYPEITPWNK